MNDAASGPRGLPKWLSFSGRAGRREYWGFAVFLWGAAVALGFLLPMSEVTVVSVGEIGVRGPWYALLARLFMLWLWLAVNARRLHDSGRSAALLVFAAIPIVSIFLCGLPRGDGRIPNAYGPPPGTDRHAA